MKYVVYKYSITRYTQTLLCSTNINNYYYPKSKPKTKPEKVITDIRYRKRN